MKLKLGFFAEFKFGDSVLLEGTPTDIALLARRLGEFAASSDSELPIHRLASVSARHPVQLFASHIDRGTGGFFWLCSTAEISAIQEKLETLSSAAAGHQYFSLAGSAAHLIVSVGEYGESWWQQHG